MAVKTITMRLVKKRNGTSPRVRVGKYASTDVLTNTGSLLSSQPPLHLRSATDPCCCGNSRPHLSGEQLGHTTSHINLH